MNDLVVKLIQLSIAKGFDIEFSECCDFHDAMTMIIIITRDDRGGIKNEYYESDRVTMCDSKLNAQIINGAMDWLASKER